MRGVEFRGGYHDFRIERGGLRIFERLVASEHHQAFAPGAVPSGVTDLDAILGGGLDRGTSALLIGPAGAGKSALAMQYAVAAALRGDAACFYTFDEGLDTLRTRSEGLGMPATKLMQAGKLRVQQIDPAEMTPGELVDDIRRDVTSRGTRVIVIDSLNGYLAAMPEEQFLIVQLHELLSFLRQRGVLTILTVAQAGLIGQVVGPVDVSYLADTVVLLRFFELRGEVRKAVSVLKRRMGKHASDIRELLMGPKGVGLGPRLSNLEGVLSGVPRILSGGE
jgi:circadian clock protein KaiC